MSLTPALDLLCPMHVQIGASGHIVHAARTITKVCGSSPVGRRFLEVFELRRPAGVTTVQGLIELGGKQLNFTMRSQERTRLRGVLVPLDDGSVKMVANFSFGISVQDAVARYDLTQADFAATDLAIEMLYLIEAKSAAMQASKQLNVRLQGAMVAAETQALTDTLTSLKNRRALDQELARLINSGDDFTLMHLDLDHFKEVNDRHGHAAGDFVLQHASAIMIDETRKEDTVARLGGDEFVMIFKGLIESDTLDRIARRIIERLEEPIDFDGAKCQISASIGVTFSSNFETVTETRIMADADAALYASKREGRGRHTIHVAD